MTEEDPVAGLSEEEAEGIAETENRWMSKASTVAGLLSVMDGLSKLGAALAFLAVARVSHRFVQSPLEHNEIMVFLLGIAAAVGVVGGLPLVGGLYSVQRRHWLVALAGGIAALLPNVPLGALCIIMLAKDRKRFR